uniref:SUEL-type lectin domain-containing protein n=1 Tax=Stomoxys calcitrans TaxID=35570 RepID=A0A1I8QC77_STOCA
MYVYHIDSHSNNGILIAQSEIHGRRKRRKHIDTTGSLLSATLRTYQKAACDTDQVVIACPRGTSISIEFAQYNKFIAKDGISIEELCPANSEGTTESRAKAKHLLRGSTFGSPTQKVPANRYVNGAHLSELTSTSGSAASIGFSTAADEDAASGTTTSADNDGNIPENCMWPNALQYSLLQTVVEACQKKKHCKFNARPQFYGLGASGVGDSSGSSTTYHSTTVSTNIISMDPCPKRRKIVEIAYKCRPYEFRSKVACHNDVAQLECNPYSRIAVYSASFGRTEYESIQCPQPQGVREETCLASYATETVMQICHGRRRCNLAADANTFGSPCQPNSRMYLKVVYTCVPKQVLMDRYETEVEADEPEDFEGDVNDLYDDELFYKESEAIPKLYSNTTVPAARNNASIALNGTFNAATSVNRANNATMGMFEGDMGGVNPVMTHSADMTLEDDQERLFVYLLTAGSLGVILCIVAIAVRLVVLKRHDSATDTHSTSSGKGGAATGGSGSGACSGGITGVEGVAETTIPNGFNDTISEVDADIDLQTPIPVPSVSKNENYISYTPATNLYGTLGPGNTLLSHSSTSGSIAPGLMSNTTIMCGPRQSPDILGISSQSYAPTSCTSTGSSTIGGILTPAIVIGASGGSVVSSGSNVIGTVVPITSLAQYTTAPTFRSGYILNSDGVLQRPGNIATPPTTSLASAETAYLGHQYQQQQQGPLSMQTTGGNVLTPATATLRRMKQSAPTASVTASPPHVLQQSIVPGSISTYDGIAPRTLSTGMAVNSQFFYE